MKYTTITKGTEVKVVAGFLYVRQTNLYEGMLEQGGYADRVYRMPYDGTLDDAKARNYWGITDIDRCIEEGKIVRKGWLIQ